MERELFSDNLRRLALLPRLGVLPLPQLDRNLLIHRHAARSAARTTRSPPTGQHTRALPQVATITIHPRDVLTRTATHRASYQGTAPLDDLRWHINLVEGTYIPGGEQSPVVWDVSYHLLFGDADLHVYVDAHTGAIIHQETITW